MWEPGQTLWPGFWLHLSLMGIALLALSALQTFSQTGFQAALIQKDFKDYLDLARYTVGR